MKSLIVTGHLGFVGSAFCTLFARDYRIIGVDYAGPGSMTDFEFAPGQVPQHRLPDFFRLDVRAEKRWELGGRRWISAVVEFFDANLAREAIDFQCNVGTGLCTSQLVGPIALPSVGVAAGF